MTTRADGVNSIALDHFPVCPRCGDVCGRLARVCASCGTQLLEASRCVYCGVRVKPDQRVCSHHRDLPPLDAGYPPVRESRVMTADHREDAPAREGKAV